MKKHDIYLSAPDVGEVELQRVMEALVSGWVAPAGPMVTSLEEEIAKRVGVAHAVALSSGTAALHLALVSWGVGPGDVVPVSTFTFAATVNAITYVGATPYLVDCDSSGNMSPALLEASLKELGRRGDRVPAVIVVDMLGKCAAYEQLRPLCAAAGARLLADAAESFGARRGEHQAGSMADSSVFSFNGNKIMTTSGGGMLVTDDRELAEHARKLATQAREPFEYYEHNEVGYNYRLSNVLAALGLAQLSRLDDMIKTRRLWRERYRAIVDQCLGVAILGGEDDADDNCWLTALIIDPERAGFDRDSLAEAMAREGIETRHVWKPVHLQPVYRHLDGRLGGDSEFFFRRGIALPSGSGMSEEQFGRVEDVLREVLVQ